jgi:hypothetical protein
MKRIAILVAVLVCVSPAAFADYAADVLALGPIGYYRSTTDPAALLDPLVNDGSLADGTWGYAGLGEDSLPISGQVGPRPENGWGGLDAGNLAARYVGNTAGGGSQMRLGTDGFNHENMSYSFFIKPDGTGWAGRIVLNNGGQDNFFQVIDLQGPAEIICVTNPGSSAASAATQTSGLNLAHDNQTWIHIVAVRNGDDAQNVELYVNGVLTPCNNPTGDNWSAGDSEARIGNRINGNAGWGNFGGAIDEVAIFDYALSREQAIGLYESATIPEPTTMLLVGTGVIGMLGVIRRRQLRR